MSRFKELRKQRKLSQAALAMRLSVSQTAVSQWETGRSSPDLPTLVKVADFYHVSTDFLLNRSDIPEIQAERDSFKVSDFERSLLTAFRALSDAEQSLVCRTLGVTNPAVRRATIKQA